MSIKVPNISLPEGLSKLDQSYDGVVVISDIDKTYLATQIDSLGGLLRTALETPESKDNIPGFSILLRALRRGGGEQAQKNPLFFVSASPPQMRDALLSKMQIDGVEHEGIIFKNQLVYVRAGEFRKLREQIGYKISALLSLWKELPKRAKLVLFGDDSESDPMIYSLFEEILSGRLRGTDLERILAYLKVFPEEAQHVRVLAESLGNETYSPVRFIFINLITGSQANYYQKYGGHLYATENSLQVAIALFENGLIRERAVRSIAREMVLHYDFEPRKLLLSAQRAARRGFFTYATLQKLWLPLFQTRAFPPPEELPEFHSEMTVMKKSFDQQQYPSKREYRSPPRPLLRRRPLLGT
jgi:hypothetical protein